VGQWIWSLVVKEGGTKEEFFTFLKLKNREKVWEKNQELFIYLFIYLFSQIGIWDISDYNFCWWYLIGQLPMMIVRHSNIVVVICAGARHMAMAMQIVVSFTAGTRRRRQICQGLNSRIMIDFNPNFLCTRLHLLGFI
jgi:hypothetical protein